MQEYSIGKIEKWLTTGLEKANEPPFCELCEELRNKIAFRKTENEIVWKSIKMKIKNQTIFDLQNVEIIQQSYITLKHVRTGWAKVEFQ